MNIYYHQAFPYEFENQRFNSYAFGCGGDHIMHIVPLSLCNYNRIMELDKLVVEKIKFGEELIDSVNNFGDLEGLTKLQRKINQELKFLKKILKNKSFKKEHLQCSNLTHFSSLLQVLGRTKNNLYVNKVFMLGERKLTIDIVCDNGLKWIKVIARNPKSLSQISMGDTGYGVRSILDQAREFAECSKLYPCLFQTPTVSFVFVNGVGSNLAVKIESFGIQVQGERLEDHFLDVDDDIDENSYEEYKGVDCNTLSTDNASTLSKVNLDVSAMLAYCSSVTNGSAGKYKFDVPVLSQQAEWELLRPQKPILDNFFKGKKLYCCETAKRNFVNIIDTVGGPNERLRAEKLLTMVIVLPDDASSEDTSESFDVQYSTDKVLNVGGKIRERSLTIFTFGDRIQAVTVTANEGFVRAARQQGINFVVFLHESRALTEQKELAKGKVV